MTDKSLMVKMDKNMVNRWTTYNWRTGQTRVLWSRWTRIWWTDGQHIIGGQDRQEPNRKNGQEYCGQIDKI